MYGVNFFMATLNDFCLIATASTDSEIQVLNSLVMLVKAPGNKISTRPTRKRKTCALADAKLEFYLCWRKLPVSVHDAYDWLLPGYSVLAKVAMSGCNAYDCMNPTDEYLKWFRPMVVLPVWGWITALCFAAYLAMC